MIQNWQRAKREISFVLIPLFRQGDVDETPWRCYGRIRHLGNVNLNPQNLSLALNENQLQSGIVLQKSKHSGYKLEVVLLEYYIWFFFSGNPEIVKATSTRRPGGAYGRIRHLGNVNLNPQNLSLALNENQLQSGIVLQKSKHSGYKLEVVLLEYYIWFFFSGNPENHLDGDVQYVGSVAHTYMRL